MKSLILALVILFPLQIQAGTGAQHARLMARSGRIFHAVSHRGAEVVASVGRGLGQRARAIAMWRRSPPHARILQSSGLLRIRCVRGYCVGTK